MAFLRYLLNGSALALIAVSCSIEPFYIDSYVTEEGSVGLDGSSSFAIEVPEGTSNVFVINDSTIVSLEDYMSGGDVFHVSRLEDDDRIHGVLNYGQENGALLSVIPGRHDGRLLVQDFVKSEVRVIDFSDPDTAIVSPNYPTDIHSQAMVPVSMDKGVFLNESSKLKKRMLATATCFKYPGRMPINDLGNISRGTIVISKDNGRYAFLDRVYSRIELFDSDGRMIQTIRKEELENQLYDTDTRGFPVFLNSYCQSFIDGCEYDEGFAALYRPGIITPQLENLSPLSYILLFDWSGHIIKSFHVASSVMNVSISRDGSSLYLYEKSSGGNRLSRYAI